MFLKYSSSQVLLKYIDDKSKCSVQYDAAEMFSDSA